MQIRIALPALLALGLCSCRSPLRGGLSEEQASEIVVALDSAAIAASKTPERAGTHNSFLVEVDRADTTRALRVLHDRKLPKAAEPGFEELYGDQALVATPYDERARSAAAAAGELGRSLRRLDGVLEARVHIALADPMRPLDAVAGPARASVLIERQSGTQPIDDAAVRSLVAGAVDGLDVAHVTVVQAVAAPHSPAVRSFVRVGPATVTSDSAPALRALLGGALMLDLVMAVALIWAWRRRRPSA